MSEQPVGSSTTDADKQAAQTQSVETKEPAGAAPPPTAPIHWEPGANLFRRVTPYRRQKQDPLYRPLRVYAIDPTQPKREGAIATINVPFEPLKKGPIGSLFEVVTKGNELDLDDPGVLIADGLAPSPANPNFHPQMVYAVCSSVYNAFRGALGRDIAWGFNQDPDKNPTEKLRLLPFCEGMMNAFYSKDEGALKFGCFRADGEGSVRGRTLPRATVYTSVSHDIIAHELSHALLDGLRAKFLVPTNPDVLAFHEAFGDIVAILQHFAYPKVVQSAMRKVKTKLDSRSVLSDVARQFGESRGQRSLRTAIDFKNGVPLVKYHDASTEPHIRGAILVAAVFATFTTVFRRKAERLIRIATQGSGVLPVGELPYDLLEMLSEMASKIASQFLAICIRAIDYCPPIDVTFGEFLRAVITADADLIPDDPWSYREAWLDAFRERNIYPKDVEHLSEDVIIWQPPRKNLPPIKDLNFAELEFAGDPGAAMPEHEIQRQADALAKVVFAPENLEVFGLCDPKLHPEADAPKIESIRCSRRIGPDEQIMFDLVAEVVQKRTVTVDGKTFPLFGGATIVIGPDGDIRYTVLKKVKSDHQVREKDLADFLDNEHAKKYWDEKDGVYEPKGDVISRLHEFVK